MAVELSEKELADLRAKAEAADKLQAEREELAKKHADAEARAAAATKKYNDDMQQVAAYLQQNQPAQPVAKSEDDDPDAIVSRRDLKKAQEESAQRAQATSAQHAALLLRNQRNINRQLAAQRLKNFDKYAAEIDAHLDRLDPAVAAQPTAYDEVHKYVRSAHFDEELEEAKKAREAEAEGEEGFEPEPTESTPARPIARSQPAAPTSSATATRPIVRSQATRPRLTDEQRRVAAGFGMTEEDYAGKWGNDDEMINNDPYGLAGRKRV